MAFTPVQAVIKALNILAELNRGGLETVGGLHAKTGIPKPTIVRLLQTLVAAGYVIQDKKLRGYHVTSATRHLSSGFHGAPKVIEIARPFVDKLTKELLWPCAICTLDFDAVVINYSTIPDSPISPFHASLGRRLSLGGRALGLAYLCFCPPSEQIILRNLMSTSEDPENNRMDDKTFEAVVARAQADGFAERSPELEPRTSGTIAMPIKSGERVLATFGITYFKSAIKQNLRSTTHVEPIHPAHSGFFPPQSVDRMALIETLRCAVAQIESMLASQGNNP
jgi:IclR family mhp operon transcriptional activator